jgi:arylsulfatase A-like enzyme
MKCQRRQMNKTLKLLSVALAMALPALLVSFFLPMSVQTAASTGRPNILFVFTDDHASHAISAYGSKINQTPNMDRLAREGMLFRNCFVTNSICAPSRAVIQTGKHSHINGVVDNIARFDGSQQTFPKLLQQAGYQTALIGKWHLKSDPTGFDYWEVLPGQGTYYNPEFLTAQGKTHYPGYTTHIITDRVLEWFKTKRDANRPFLLMYQHKAPHRDWQPGPEYMRMYDGVEIPEPETLFDDYSTRGTAAHTQKMRIADDLDVRDLKLEPPSFKSRFNFDESLTTAQLDAWKAAYGPRNEAFQKQQLQGRDLVHWKYERYIKDYLRCIAAVDDDLGRVLEYLDQSGLARNTVVVYNSDQGFYLGDHGWFDKRFMYEESLRTPLIVRWPEMIKPGSEDRHLVQNLDFAPTFLQLAGAPIPVDLQGVSLVPLLRGEDPPDWRKSVYYHYYEYPAVHSVRRHCGVRTERYKLIHFYQLDEWELYDLERDPKELNNVYSEPAYSDVVANLKKELVRLRALYKVPDVDPPAGVRPRQ